jgi:putative membrane protein
VPASVAQFIRGFAMGTADIVPGISGGTVALVAGIYERLVRNIHAGAHLLRALVVRREITAAARSIEWRWLLTLLAGILTAIAVLSSVLTRLLEDQPILTSAVFFGLVVGAIVVARRRIGTITPISLLAAAVAAMALFFVLGLRSETESTADKVVTQPLWIFFIAGAIAICAMILPGISGSLILVIIGMYSEVLGAVTSRDFAAVAATGLGAIAGLAAFSTLLNWLLEHHHDLVIATMIGLMIGSLRVLWPWPNGTATTRLGAPDDHIVAAVILLALGAIAVIAIERLSARVAPPSE